ncbi:MAG: MFS transporter [Bacteroidetes bacterium GWF2_42_66]|nr:MAG: MFS transporter [Bacteroidetes bacterium GWA2_42_15]OFX96935.1 MAG: MFS transporter [Bacteroidetes bacterium GWE2_42_39]OFY44692.1 MAG: MFS transporter [Bacteroidetes bacterium GWF2_42_66]HBL75020.1 MFS transporter [Prolixibacteraceae bacterium]HCR92158.1 MFS transporter [Prolixibacteraceae bacterium]
MSTFLSPERRRWFIVAVIFIITVFSYVDRQVVSILKPILKEEFSLDDIGYALIINVFTICYALMYPVSGWLVDKFGARKIMFWGVITWSLSSIGSGLVRNLLPFTFFRSVLGLAEPTTYPAQIKVVTKWFSGRLRATANSISVAGGTIGSVIAPPLIAWLVISFSWHAAFIIPGMVGIIVALVWFLIYKEPPRGYVQDTISSESDSAKSPAFTWGQLWSKRSLWGILLIRFTTDPVWYFILFWLPGFLMEESGLSLSQLGMVGWIPFMAASLGGIASSAWSDWMVRRGKPALRSRKVMLSYVAFLAPVILIPDSLGVAVTIIKFSILAAVALSWIYTGSVLIAETFPVNNVASVLGIAGGFGAGGAVIFNYLIGQYMTSVGTTWIFMAMAVLHPLALFILWKMIRPEIPKESAVH